MRMERLTLYGESVTLDYNAACQKRHWNRLPSATLRVSFAKDESV